MKYRQHLVTSTLILTLALAFGLEGSFAQQRPPANDWEPLPSNQAGKQYPQVNSERQVRFRFAAPEASSVSVDLGGGTALTRGDDGTWTGTTRPLDEGFHYYSVKIDGLNVPDPNSRYFYGASRWGSGVEIPARDQDFYAVENVPHGDLRETLYYSQNADAVLRCFVYTPPGYDKNRSRRYPVLYLQHGAGEDESGWGQQGHAGLIMDNLIAAGKSRPFIIVMANSYIPNADRLNSASAQGKELSRSIEGVGGRKFTFNPFAKVLIEDLIPFIDTNYRTLKDQPHRALAGLSMGGMQARSIALANTDTFSHIGIFSGGSIGTAEIADFKAFKKLVDVVFVSYGSREDGASGRQNTAALQQAGVNAVFYESPETAHEWLSWRRSLRQFAPLLFRD
jgi:enterochelin esterase-like enzyme